MGPWAALLERIAAALEGVAHKPNVLAGPHSQVAPDTIMLRPDNPWVSRGTDGRPVRFGGERAGMLERYVAVIATRAAEPASSMASLYLWAGAVQAAASDEGWDWVDVGGIVLDESTDTPLLVAHVRLTYSG